MKKEILFEPESWHENLQAMYNYWLKIHPAEGGMPSRADFDPLDIPHLLPIMWMYDVSRAKPYRFKFGLVGTEIVDLLKTIPPANGWTKNTQTQHRQARMMIIAMLPIIPTQFIAMTNRSILFRIIAI